MNLISGGTDGYFSGNLTATINMPAIRNNSNKINNNNVN